MIQKNDVQIYVNRDQTQASATVVETQGQVEALLNNIALSGGRQTATAALIDDIVFPSDANTLGITLLGQFGSGAGSFQPAGTVGDLTALSVVSVSFSTLSNIRLRAALNQYYLLWKDINNWAFFETAAASGASGIDVFFYATNVESVRGSINAGDEISIYESAGGHDIFDFLDFFQQSTPSETLIPWDNSIGRSITDGDGDTERVVGGAVFFHPNTGVPTFTFINDTGLERNDIVRIRIYEDDVERSYSRSQFDVGSLDTVTSEAGISGTGAQIRLVPNDIGTTDRLTTAEGLAAFPVGRRIQIDGRDLEVTGHRTTGTVAVIGLVARLASTASGLQTTPQGTAINEQLPNNDTTATPLIDVRKQVTFTGSLGLSPDLGAVGTHITTVFTEAGITTLSTEAVETVDMIFNSDPHTVYYFAQDQVRIDSSERVVTTSINTNTISYSDSDRLDINKDLPLVLVQKLQDFRDIKKVFANNIFSFEVPWSKNNASIFRDYNKFDVDDGFDARRYLPCDIELNARPYDVGLLELLDINYEHGQPKSANVRYSGRLAEITEQVGDDTLQDLFQGWSFRQSGTLLGASLAGNGDIQTGVQSNPPSFATDSSLKYMVNSAGRRLIHDTENNSQAANQAGDMLDIPYRNLSGGANDFTGLDVNICKPWIKADDIVRAIEANYSFGFDRTDEFSFLNGPVWQSLYQILHSKERDENPDNVTASIAFSDFSGATFTSNGQALISYDNGNVEVITLGSGFRILNQSTTEQVSFNLTITPATGHEETEYSVELVSSGVAVANSVTQIPTGAGTRSADSRLVGVGQGYYNITSQPGFQYSVYLSIRGVPGSSSSFNELGNISSGNASGSAILPASSEFFIDKNLPNQKVIDWLSGIWKMFNTTAYPNVDRSSDGFGRIKTQTLDIFNGIGNQIDLTDTADPFKYTISRPEFYSDIQFTFEDPVTFTGTNFENANGRQYGEEKWNGTGVDDLERKIYKPYTLDIPFQQFPYDIVPSLGLVYPYIADEGGANVAMMSHFAFPSITDVADGQEIVVRNGTNLNSTYVRASKIYDLGGQNEVALTFYPEIDEYLAVSGSGATVVNNTLFQRYYSAYTRGVFSERTKIRKGNSYLPPNIIDQLMPNTVITIGNNKFRVNTNKVDLLSGKSNQELSTFYELEDPSETRFGVGIQATLSGPTSATVNAPLTYFVALSGTEDEITQAVFSIDGVNVIEAVNTDNRFSLTPMTTGSMEIGCTVTVGEETVESNTITLQVNEASTSGTTINQGNPNVDTGDPTVDTGTPTVDPNPPAPGVVRFRLSNDSGIASANIQPSNPITRTIGSAPGYAAGQPLTDIVYDIEATFGYDFDATEISENNWTIPGFTLEAVGSLGNAYTVRIANYSSEVEDGDELVIVVDGEIPTEAEDVVVTIRGAARRIDGRVQIDVTNMTRNCVIDSNPPRNGSIIDIRGEDGDPFSAVITFDPRTDDYAFAGFGLTHRIGLTDVTATAVETVDQAANDGRGQVIYNIEGTLPTIEEGAVTGILPITFTGSPRFSTPATSVTVEWRLGRVGVFQSLANSQVLEGGGLVQGGEIQLRVIGDGAWSAQTFSAGDGCASVSPEFDILEGDVDTVLITLSWRGLGQNAGDETSAFGFRITPLGSVERLIQGTVALREDDLFPIPCIDDTGSETPRRVSYNLTNNIVGTQYTIDNVSDQVGVEGNQYTFTDPVVRPSGGFTITPVFSGDSLTGMFGATDSMVNRAVSGTITAVAPTTGTNPGVVPDPGVDPDPDVVPDPGVVPDPDVVPDPGVTPTVTPTPAQQADWTAFSNIGSPFGATPESSTTNEDRCGDWLPASPDSSDTTVEYINQSRTCPVIQEWSADSGAMIQQIRECVITVEGTGTARCSSPDAAIGTFDERSSAFDGTYNTTTTQTRRHPARNGNYAPPAITLGVSITGEDSVEAIGSFNWAAILSGTATGLATYSWSITNNTASASLDSTPSARTATVLVEGAGSFTLNLSVTRQGVTESDSLRITVTGGEDA